MGIKANDKDAFDAFYRDTADCVYHTALRYSGNHHVAEEISQTVFMKLYMNLGNVQEEAMISWMLTAAKHMALNYKRGLRREVLLGDLLYDENEESAFESDLEDEIIRKLYAEENKELVANIFADLYHLNSRWYDALTITYFLGKPQKEVANCMDMKLEVLHSVLYRAKKWVRKNYEEQYNHLNEQ